MTSHDGPASAPLTTRQKVLVLEDDGELRRMFRRALALAGYDVDEAVDGLDVLEILDLVDPPHAIVLDLQMPRACGVIVCHEIAEYARTLQIPVVIVTDVPEEYQPIDAQVLKKPITAQRLVRAVRSSIASASQRPDA
jgi:DNA-binding response OmpR family regulator